MVEPKPEGIDAKSAVAQAIAYVSDMYKEDDIADVLLEELEMNDTETRWRVTVSFLRRQVPASSNAILQAAILGQLAARSRAYKVVEVDRSTGQIRAMRIREMPRANA